MNRKLALNCDLGESFGSWEMGDDEAVMPFIDSANIACGGHAGDPTTMRRCVELAVQNCTEIGAHVSYPDKQGFGRRKMEIRGQDLLDLIHYQIGGLDGIARVKGTKVEYVKPHGAMYHAMLADPDVLNEIMAAVSSWHYDLELVVMATNRDQKTVQLAVEHRLKLRYEAFADRAYTSEGLLLGRNNPGALLDTENAVKQAVAIAGNQLKSACGKHIPLEADTLCVHSDTPEAIKLIHAIRQVLD